MQQVDKADRRFAFGDNWKGFLATVDEVAIASSVEALRSMLGESSLHDRSFLDIGSGSGLSSLAAHRLGARVTSFDYDQQSVECTELLRSRYGAGKEWKIFHGSILDAKMMEAIGQHDIVYSWGVLHHTGELWRALDNAMHLVKPGGTLFIALYNDQGLMSRYWLAIKKAWVFLPILRPLIVLVHAPYMLGLVPLVQFFCGRKKLPRGMKRWTDMIDWLGGYPFEVAKPDLVIDKVRPLGFRLSRIKTCGGRHGCNEFVFRHDISVPISVNRY
jgi:2-polyprenyl-3-methyl-5-hydroxy-6-metoxy-1,4-benzoquinol methylase